MSINSTDAGSNAPRQTLESFVYDWEQIPPEPTRTGQKRAFFRGPTGTLNELACHVTTLEPGLAAHAPHQHPEEEMILLKEGVLEAMINGRTQRMGPGSILLLAPNDLHGVTNVGSGQATYYVFKWFPPGMARTKK